MESTRDPVSAVVIGAAIEVHRHLGPGLLESAYESCLSHELKLRGVDHRTQFPLPIQYKVIVLDEIYRIDLLIPNQLVEIKSAELIAPVHEAQLLTYLRMSGIHTRLLLNFNVPVQESGIKRMVL